MNGLPVRFSYYNSHDVQQLSDPDQFFFVETSVGVEKKALSKMGSLCYINPLNTKMDDNCQLEVRITMYNIQHTLLKNIS